MSGVAFWGGGDGGWWWVASLSGCDVGWCGCVDACDCVVLWKADIAASGYVSVSFGFRMVGICALSIHCWISFANQNLAAGIVSDSMKW